MISPSKEKRYGYFEIFSKLNSVISIKLKVKLIFSLFLMFVAAASELLTVGSVIPLSYSILNRENKLENVESVSQIAIDLLSNYTSYEMLFLFLFLVCATGFIRIINVWYQARLGSMIIIELSELGFWRQLVSPPLDPSNLYDTSSSLITDIEKINDLNYAFIEPLLKMIFSSTVVVVVLLGIGKFIPGEFAYVLLGLFFYFIFSGFLSHRSLHVNSTVISKNFPILVNLIQSAHAGRKEIYLSRSANFFLAGFSERIRSYHLAVASNRILKQIPRIVLDTLLIMLIVWFVISQLELGSLDRNAPVLLMIGFAAQRLIPYFQQIYASCVAIKGRIQNVCDAVNRLGLFDNDLTVVPAEVYAAPHKGAIEIDSIRLVNVSFRYPRSNSNVFTRVSLSLEKGRRYGICGESGQGKSTFIHVLTRLLEPSEGEFLINSEPVDTESQHLYQNVIGYHGQNSFVIDGTVLSNVAFGYSDVDIDLTKIRKVLEVVELADLIYGNLSGVHSLVNDFGSNFSGGQRQRLALARCLYRDPQVLILDEPTSSLDTGLAVRIFQRIQAEFLGILVLVSHQEELLEMCSDKYRLRDGRLAKI